MTVTKVTPAECKNGKAITADGSYLLQVGGPAKTVGAFNTIFAKGTFGGATITFKATPDGSDTNAMAITGGTLTADGFYNFIVKSSGGMLAVVSGAGGSTNFTMWAI